MMLLYAYMRGHVFEIQYKFEVDSNLILKKIQYHFRNNIIFRHLLTTLFILLFVNLCH